MTVPNNQNLEEAIEEILKYTRPIHIISRSYAGLISPGTATFFFVNDRGVAVTCKHVANVIMNADAINIGYESFKKERAGLVKDGKFHRNLNGLEIKYRYNSESTVQMKNNFLNSFDKIDEITCHLHPTLDLAIMEFKGFNQIYYTSHAKFLKDSREMKQGKYLCRVGFPFPEFNNFRHNAENDDIEWTGTGNQNSPAFPIDGIITRFVGDPEQGITGIEMSTPGLKGQSGGPLFDPYGRVYGMQFATNHLHLGFDLRDREILQENKKTKVSNFPFLHVGLCVHIDKIKEFLSNYKIDFEEV